MTNQAQSKNSNHAIWYFVAAVFIAVSPTLGQPLNITIAPWISWSAAAILTFIGFWYMFRRA